MLSVRYIMSELEEIEREDNFRLKRFKELKYKNQKGDDDTNKHCYCNKQTEKGDDFVCFVCKQKEEKINQSKKSPCVVNVQSCPEVIGDKASCRSTVNQKRLDDLNAHLEKVISLTCQCKLDGLVSPSVDRLIYACEEVRCKLETDQKQTTDADEQAPQKCNALKEEVNLLETQEVPRETCKGSDEKQDEKEDDSLGYFETKYKETVKVMKFKNEDGTISEERQVVTIKTEKKHPHKPNSFGMSPCSKVRPIASITSEESKSDFRDGTSKHPKETKSEEIPSCMKKELTKARSCISDSGSSKIRKKESNESSMLKCCKDRDATPGPELPSPVSYICCPEKSPSENLSNKSKVSTKSSKTSNKSCKSCKPSEKDVSCECKTEVKSVGCDPVWKDVASSTTGLAESSEETEELCICIKESDMVAPAEKADKVSIGQKSANSSMKLCCIKTSEETEKRESSHTCSICNKGNIELEGKSVKEKPSSIKSHTCFTPPPEVKKSGAEIDKKPQPCCNIIESDKKPKTSYKIRVISNQGKGKVQEFIFFGNILDAITKILVPNKSNESLIKILDTKETDVATKARSKNENTLSKKSSFKSSMCKTCEIASKVSSKILEKSQSCRQCNTKNIEKSISWSRPRSQSADNSGKGTPKLKCSCKSRTDIISKCSVCGSELSKSMRSETTSVDVENEECISCEIESCPISRTTSSPAINFKYQEEDPGVCHSPPKKPLIKLSELKCKMCHRPKPQCECALSKNVKNEQMEPPKLKCKVCYPDEDPYKCRPKDQNQGPPKIERTKSKCKICHRDKTQCICYSSKDVKNDTVKETESPKSKYKTFCPQEENQNKLSKWCQTETPHRKQEDIGKRQKDSEDSICLCSKDQNSTNWKQTKESSNSVPNTKSPNLLCCGYPPNAGKDETDCEKCTEAVVMKDASTSTRRSDRYDVRPLRLINPVRKLTCTCNSDSYLTQRSTPPPKRCSSCHADYYKRGDWGEWEKE